MNIAEILKNAPKGTKLYSPAFGKVKLICSDYPGKFPIQVLCLDANEAGILARFTNDGKCFPDSGEVMLFPSKENRDWFTFKAKPQFPTTYEECCKLLNDTSTQDNDVSGYRENELYDLQMLLICRDAWWKADNDWWPDYTAPCVKYCINVVENEINQNSVTRNANIILIFRTEEIRDNFLETFRDLIENCKGLI